MRTAPGLQTERGREAWRRCARGVGVRRLLGVLAASCCSEKAQTGRGSGARAVMIEVICNDRLGKKIRVKCKCVPRVHRAEQRSSVQPYWTAFRLCRRCSCESHELVCCGSEDDTIGDLKKLLAAQIGTRAEKLRIQKWYTIYKDHITLEDYEIHDGMGLELYYN